jgi:death on curing protein
MPVRYLVLEDVLELHAVVIRLSGGSLGVRDHGVLTGCLDRPKTAFGGSDMYPTLHTKAAVYIDTVARNHPLIDGNKRTAFLSGARFLAMNDVALNMDDDEIVRGMIWIVTEHPSIEQIAEWLKEHSEKKT